MTFRRYVVLTNMGTIYKRYWTRKGARSVAKRMAAHGSTYSVVRDTGRGYRVHTDVFRANMSGIPVDDPRPASEAEPDGIRPTGLQPTGEITDEAAEWMDAPMGPMKIDILGTEAMVLAKANVIRLQEVLELLIMCAEVHLTNLRMDDEKDEAVKNDLLAIFKDARVFLKDDPEEWKFTEEATEAGARIVLGRDEEHEQLERDLAEAKQLLAEAYPGDAPSNKWRCRVEKLGAWPIKEPDPCSAVYWHGPGHQSRAMCVREDEHTLHRAGLADGREATWYGEAGMSGFFDEIKDPEEPDA